MRSQSFLILLALWMLVPSTGYSAEVKPIYAKQKTFRIPFDIEPYQNQSQAPREIRLYVSDDRGANWWQATSVDPSAGGFSVSAPSDGEYWFVVKTVDQYGRQLPEVAPGAKVEPEMKVIIDTQVPELKLQASSLKPGQMLVRWEAKEPNAKTDRPVIEYRSLSSEQPVWRPLVVSAGHWFPSTQTLRGEISLPVPAGMIEVRAHIYDSAGNVSTSETYASAKPTAQSAVQQVAAQAPVQTPYQQQGTGPAPVYNGSKKQWDALATRSRVPSGKQNIVDERFGPGEKLESNGIHAVMYSENNGAYPAGVKPIMVNSKRFRLEYDVDSVGPSGIANVEVWGTRDNGKTWTLYGIDADQHSPVDVTVIEEGLYGFKMVVESGSGVGGESPLLNEVPDLWVQVDLTKPRAELSKVSSGDRPGEIVFLWKAEDANFGKRPISLFYSASPAGPWYPVAEGLENTGSYTWITNDRLPAQIHFRMAVKDKSDNVTLAHSRDAHTSDNIRPRGKILMVRPDIRGRALR